jgi:hypothetical protein
MASGMTAKPRKSSAAKLDTRALIRPGTQIVCAMADFDAADGYQIRLDEVGDVIRFSYASCDEEAEELEELEEFEGTVAVTASTVAGAAEVMFLSQGSYTPGESDDSEEPYKHCTPPFLVSRKTLAALKAGETARLTIYGETGSLVQDGKETTVLKIDGEDRQVSVVCARDDDNGMSVKVLDDEAWPLLLSAEFQDDNYIKLMAIHSPADQDD